MTGILKDSIQDSLDMIVINGKFNNASPSRALDTKYPLVMKKSNPIDVVFKDKSKFDTQNPIIDTLLIQIQSRKTKTEKAIENQLKGAPSIKGLQIAERLEHSKQNNKRNNNGDKDDDNDTPPPPAPPNFVPLPHYSPFPSFDSHDDSDIEDQNPIQKLLLGDSRLKKLHLQWEKRRGGRNNCYKKK